MSDAVVIFRERLLADGASPARAEHQARRAAAAYGRLTEAFSAQQWRNRVGEWIDMPDVDLGMTPYRGRSRNQAAYRQTSRYRSYEANRDRIAREEGVRIKSVQAVDGMWLGETEPADSVRVSGDREAIERFALRVGKRYNQDAVMIFDPDDNGPGVAYSLDGVKDTKQAFEILRQLDQPGGRFHNGKVEIVEEDASIELLEAVTRVAQDNALQIGYSPGYAAFPGRPYPEDLAEGQGVRRGDASPRRGPEREARQAGRGSDVHRASRREAEELTEAKSFNPRQWRNRRGEWIDMPDHVLPKSRVTIERGVGPSKAVPEGPEARERARRFDDFMASLDAPPPAPVEPRPSRVTIERGLRPSRAAPAGPEATARARRFDDFMDELSAITRSRPLALQSVVDGGNMTKPIAEVETANGRVWVSGTRGNYTIYAKANGDFGPTRHGVATNRADALKRMNELAKKDASTEPEIEQIEARTFGDAYKVWEEWGNTLAPTAGRNAWEKSFLPYFEKRTGRKLTPQLAQRLRNYVRKQGAYTRWDGTRR